MSQSNVFEQTATINSWDSDYYHPIAERLYDWAIRDMLQLMGAMPGSTVLDAGCGPGVHSIRAARAGLKVVAADISQAMLGAAKERVERAGVAPAVIFEKQDLTRFTFKDASFQYVFSWGVIIHIHEVEKALDELARVTAPRGSLAIYVTNRSSLDQKLEAAVRGILRRPLKERANLPLGDGTWYDMSGQRLWVWQFDIRELVKQMSDRGLHLVHRMCGEFSEIQRRLPRFLRPPLLHLNNLYYRLNLPAGAAIGNLLIFRKD